MSTELYLEEVKGRVTSVKFIVKKWEESYKIEHGSRPNKEAINFAPQDIKDAYKMYWRCSRLLTNHKISVHNNHKNDENLKQTLVSSNGTQNETLSTKDEQIAASPVLQSEAISHSCQAEASSKSLHIEKDKRKSTVWGNHLNKNESLAPIKNFDSDMSLYSKMAENMKTNAKVKTRTSLKRVSSLVKHNQVNIKPINNSGHFGTSSEAKFKNSYLPNRNINSSCNTLNDGDENIISNSHNLIDREKNVISNSHSLIDRDVNGVRNSFNLIERDEEMISNSNSLLDRDGNIISKRNSLTERDDNIIYDPQNFIDKDKNISSDIGKSIDRNENKSSPKNFINRVETSICNLKLPRISKNNRSKNNSKSVSLLSTNSNVKSKAIYNQHCNKDWVRRCSNNIIGTESLNDYELLKGAGSLKTSEQDLHCRTVKKSNLNINNFNLCDTHEGEGTKNCSETNLSKRKYEASADEGNNKRFRSSTVKSVTEFPLEEASMLSGVKSVGTVINERVSDTKGEIDCFSTPLFVEIKNNSMEHEENSSPRPLCQEIESNSMEHEENLMLDTEEINESKKPKTRSSRKVKEKIKTTNSKKKFRVTVPKNASKKISIKTSENSNKLPDVRMAETSVGASNKLEEYNELTDIENKEPKKSAFKRKYISKEDRFFNKVSSGKVNENFVKINLKKKVFVRGQKHLTGEKYRRQEWKKKQVMKQAEGGDEKSIKKLTCYRCGDFGHWAQKCPGKIGDQLLPVNDYDENESTFLTLDEAANMAKGIKPCSENVTKLYKNDSEISEVIDSKNDKNGLAWESDDDMFATIDLDGSNCNGNKEYNVKETVLKLQPKLKINEPIKRSVEPLYQSNDHDMISTPKEVFETLKLFGYNEFRTGQEETIMRILSGHSTLLILSTGSGKSLCYQLPAYMYAKKSKCITLCVSPLVSLMEDQVTGLPPFLKAVCLHTQQSAANREKALNILRSGEAHILLVSPEAIVSSRGGGILGTLLKELPPIAFACLDEAHCLSEWSHNFRPSYLQVCKVLKEKLNVHTLLGLTATARKDTAESIAKYLHIPTFNRGVIMGTCIPSNLMLSVSRDENRELALIHLLTGERFQTCSSIIIYCTRRDECERVATFIRTQLLTPAQIDTKSNSSRNRGISIDAEAYHAGLSSFRRQQIQKRFMSGKLRIVVATVAFGMGIDKADVQGIIHFNMPRNLESYVQEIGRAGRDGNVAHCHLFLDSSDGKDIQELKRHIFVNSVDRHTVRKLLNKVFVPCTCAKINKLGKISNDLDAESSLNESNKKLLPENNSQTITSLESEELAISEQKNKSNLAEEELIDCPGHEVALPIESLIEALDLPEENIQTLFCYLALHSNSKLTLNHHVYATCRVTCYQGPKQLCAVSRRCPPLAVAIAFQRQQGRGFEKKNSITFPVVEIASRMGWDSRIVKQELKNLEWNTSNMNAGGKIAHSGVKVEFEELAFHLTCRGDMSEEELDQILEDLYLRACLQEKKHLMQLQYTYKVLRECSHSSNIFCSDAIEEERSSKLKETIHEYFSTSSGEGGLPNIQLEEQLYIRPEIEQRIKSDIRSLLSTHTDQSWTGRAIARVLHGISSPNFPASVWGRVRKFWRLHLEVDFNLVVTLATKEILRWK